MAAHLLAGELAEHRGDVAGILGHLLLDGLLHIGWDPPRNTGHDVLKLQQGQRWIPQGLHQPLNPALHLERDKAAKARMKKRKNNNKRKKERGDVQHPIPCGRKITQPFPELQEGPVWVWKGGPQYLAAEEGLWQAVAIHHVDQVVQHVVEDAMELLTPQCCALDLGQGACVQLSLQQGTASLSSCGPPALGTASHPQLEPRVNLQGLPEWEMHIPTTALR